ncbi:MAG: type II toxin-antitoxin system RelE/ParE family toxin [FCB group bacterium]|nr:type II toxin-antitoxin system RelE/ParE family toxin [FCB group bacterium]
MDYTVHLHGQAIKALRRLSQKNKALVQRVVSSLAKLSQEPLQGKPLKGPLKGSYRIRIGDYRVIYDIVEKDKTVLVWKIQHRREVYR